MTACKTYREWLSETLDHTLKPGDQLQLDRHLKECPGCRAEWEELQWARQHLQGLQPVATPPWLTARVMARIRGEAVPKPSFWRRFLLPIVLNPQLHVASLLLLAATGYYLIRTPIPQADSVGDAQSQPMEKAVPAQPSSAPGRPSPKADSLRQKAAPAPAEAPTPLKDQEQVQEEKAEPFQFAPAPAKEGPRRDLPAPALTPPPAPAARAAGAGFLRGNEQDESGDRKAKKSAPAAEAKADSSELAKAQSGVTSGEAQPEVIRIEATDPQTARAGVARVVDRVGGTLLPRPEREGGRSLTVRIETRRLQEFLRLVGQVGRVTEQPESPGETSLLMTLIIRW